MAALVVLCAAATVPAGVEAHGGIYHYAERSVPDGLAVIALWTGLIVGLALLSAAFTGSSTSWSSPRRLLTVAAGVAVMAMPISGVAWSFAVSDDNGLIIMQPGDEFLASSYSGEYGGLVTNHHFGQGKTVHNPPDILEAGGYMVDLTYTTDGQRVDYFTMQTLRGKRFDFLIRPEIVPVNWSPWVLQVYRDCRCMVALHFTQRDVGNVAIVLFEVSSAMYD
ncbi:MAG: hypothetical protein IIB33_02955 [Chloroflexi bacterium]|nr:hypothetical protein [Chloroflexota bacterium]